MTKKKKGSFKESHPVDLNKRECIFDETVFVQVALTNLKNGGNSRTGSKYEGEGLQILVVLNAEGTKKLAGHAVIDICKSLNMNCFSSDFESQLLKDSPDPKAEIIYSFTIEMVSENAPMSTLRDEQSSAFGTDSFDASIGYNSVSGRSNSRQKSTYLGKTTSQADNMARIFDDEPVLPQKSFGTDPTEYGYKGTSRIDTQLSEARNQLFNDSNQDQSISRTNIRRLKLSPNTSRSQERRGNSNVKISLKSKPAEPETSVSQSSNLVIGSQLPRPQPVQLSSFQPPAKRQEEDLTDIFVASYPLPSAPKPMLASDAPGPHWRQPPPVLQNSNLGNSNLSKPSVVSPDQKDEPVVASRFKHLVAEQDPPTAANKPQIWNSTLSFAGNNQTATLGGNRFGQNANDAVNPTNRSAFQSEFAGSGYSGSVFALSRNDQGADPRKLEALEAQVATLTAKLKESEAFASSLTSQHGQALDLLKQRSQLLQNQLAEQSQIAQSMREEANNKDREVKSTLGKLKDAEQNVATLKQENAIKTEKLQKQSKLIEELTVQLKSHADHGANWKQRSLESESKLTSLLQDNDRLQSLEASLREKETIIRQHEREVKSLSTKLAHEQNRVIMLENRVSELENSQLLSKQQQSLSATTQVGELKNQLSAELSRQEELRAQLQASAHRILELEDAKTDLEEQVAQQVRCGTHAERYYRTALGRHAKDAVGVAGRICCLRSFGREETTKG